MKFFSLEIAQSKNTSFAVFQMQLQNVVKSDECSCRTTINNIILSLLKIIKHQQVQNKSEWMSCQLQYPNKTIKLEWKNFF